MNKQTAAKPANTLEEIEDRLEQQMNDELRDLQDLIKSALQKQAEMNNAFYASILARLDTVEEVLGRVEIGSNAVEKLDSIEKAIEEKLLAHDRSIQAAVLSRPEYGSQLDTINSYLVQINSIQNKLGQSLNNVLVKQDSQAQSSSKLQYINTMLGNINSLSSSLDRKIGDVLKKQDDLAKPKEYGYPYEKIGSKYYILEHYAHVNWYEAFAKCRSEGGNLVTFESLVEFYDVRLRLVTRGYWIGLIDITRSGRYVSIRNGRTPPYEKWHFGEPNNGIGSENLEYCGELWYLYFSHFMNDACCTTKKGYICEAGLG